VYACVRGGELTVSLASNEDFTRLFPAPCLTDDFFHTLAEVEIGSLGDNKAAEDSIRKLSDFLLSAYEASSSQCTAITQSADQECQTTSSVSSPNGGRCQEASGVSQVYARVADCQCSGDPSTSARYQEHKH